MKLATLVFSFIPFFPELARADVDPEAGGQVRGGGFAGGGQQIFLISPERQGADCFSTGKTIQSIQMDFALLVPALGPFLVILIQRGKSAQRKTPQYPLKKKGKRGCAGGFAARTPPNSPSY